MQFQPQTKKELADAIKALNASEEKYGPIGTWDTSLITNMSYLFMNQSKFNKNINSWNVSNVTNMSYMFHQCYEFNQPLDQWNTFNVTDMSYMFCECSTFNQPLDQWDVANVTDMSYMFGQCYVFNQPLDQWDVSNVTNMEKMFDKCYVFNQPLGQWDVSKVDNMFCMFYQCNAFNQKLNSWNLYDVYDTTGMFSLCRSMHTYNSPINVPIVNVQVLLKLKKNKEKTFTREEIFDLLNIYYIISKKEDYIFDLIYGLHGEDSYEHIFRDYDPNFLDEKSDGVKLALDKKIESDNNEDEYD